MSSMLRANKTGGSARKSPLVRSFSLSGGSSSSSSDSDGGARLSAASLDDLDDSSPPRVRFSSVTEEFSRLSATSSSSDNSDKDAKPTSFQVGQKPSGDVFTASPVKGASLKNGQDLSSAVMAPFAERMAAKSAAETTEEHRITRAVATPNALVMGPPADRAYRTPSARTLSARHEIGDVDAQVIYPPTACVFVANLPEAKDDRALEAAVTRVFSQFGTVFVKIRREMKGTSNGMPYAFAQYTNDEDANVAMEEARGAMILGRPCRTEMVKANRTFIVYSRLGDDITVNEARDILELYGELSKCELLSAQIQAVLGLPSAVLVEFAKFDPKRDLNSAVRQYDGFRIDAFDVKKQTLIPRPDADEEFLRKYDVDRRSVFVGGLPVDTNKDQLIEFFSEVGEVTGANVVTRQHYHGFNPRLFGFVEFARADLPDQAVEMLDGSYFRGSVLKVERKVFKHIGTPRRVKSQAFSIKSSVTPKTPRPAAATPVRASFPSGGHISGRREMPPPATQQGYNFSATAGPSFVASQPAPSPAAPVNGEPLIGASGLPVTPSMTPFGFGPTPFNYQGGFWPGMSIAQDPITGHTFWAYTPPVGAATQAAAPTDTPTRGREREHQYFHGA